MSRRLELLDGVIYADAFDCALTLEEVWRYARLRIDQDDLRRELRDDPAVVGRDGLYALADRPHLIEQRPERIARARALQQRGRRVARVLRHLPFVRALALTGSVAADDAHDAADVDLLVIVAPEKLGTAFLLMGPVSTLLRRRLFCPNYYVCEGRLAMAPGNPYVARELMQARCLAGPIAGLHESNPWLAETFPNAAGAGPGLSPGGRLQRAQELALRGRLGDAVERLGAWAARSRLRAHYATGGRSVPLDVSAALDAGTSLRFHGRHRREATVARYLERRTQVAEMADAREARSA
jgi:predicted nucleotidyltransferase